MITLLLFFLIEILFLSVIPIGLANAESVSLIIVFLNSIILIAYLVTNKLIQHKWIILISFILKCLIMFSSYYDLFPIMFTGADSVRFERQALGMWENPELLSRKYGTLYQPFLGYLYTIIGPQKMMAQFVNLILSIMGLIIIDRLFGKIEVEYRHSTISIAILSFSPVSIILSSVLMRDALVANFFIYSVCFFVLYVYEKNIMHILLSLFFLMIASAFHSGVFPFIIGILIYIWRETDKNSFITKFLCCFLVLIGVYVFSDVLFSKFSGLEKSESEILEQLADARGGSAYLTSLQSNNIIMNLLFSPLKIVYFLFSPMLWDVRHLGDIIMILLDSVLYYFLCISTLQKLSMDNIRLRNSLLIGLLFVLFAFANGTHNSGTAARHRYKILPALCVIYGLSHIKNENYESENLDNRSCV